MTDKYKVVALRFPSFYIQEFDRAIAFYTSVFGPPKADEETIKGWELGDTWLTLFPALGLAAVKDKNPRNAEFAVQVETPEQVDALYAAMIAAGASECMPPEDTEMYVPMRFCCVDDPVGIRIDVFCPLDSKE